MEQMENGLMTVLPNDIAEYDYEAIIVMAERSEKLVAALNKMMLAAIKITTWLDWCLIGGKPYLQESGATKVARLFGIGWKILDVQKEMDEGYPSYSYRMAFTMGNSVIECEGSRSGKDDFFTGAKTLRNGEPNPKYKSADQIDANDVKKAAYTNCLNNGIKRMLPGLRNIDIASLEQGGIEVKKINGYSFKEGSNGGSGRATDNTGLVCAGCGAPISQKIASYSEGKFGKKLCLNCQKNPPIPTDDEDSIPLPEEPPVR